MPDQADPPRGDEAGNAVSIALTYRRLLGHRLYVHTWVRLAVAVTMVATAYIARDAAGIEDLDADALSILAAVIAGYALATWPAARRFRDPDHTRPDYAQVVGATYRAVVFDFVALTVAIWFLGGARSPFVAFYLLHVIVTTITLPRQKALLLMGVAYGLLVLLVAGECWGFAPPRMPAGVIDSNDPLVGSYAVVLLLVYATLFGLTSFLVSGLTKSLRRVERRIRMANAELSRLSEQRKGFLHIAVHNLKAPVGAVTMFLENMRTGLAGPVTEKQQEWLERSLARLGDLTDFMGTMHALASIETDIIRAEFTRVDLPELLERVVEEYRDVAEAKGHQLTLRAQRPAPPVVGSSRLLKEAVVNYVTNAIKYTPDGGLIRVRLRSRDPAIRIEVSDNGVGIAPADQERLFGEFVRIPNDGTAVAKVKGSGLGLSIVKRIVEAHGGTVGVISRKGKGSKFFLELPILHE